jgi:hypothetical protein
MDHGRTVETERLKGAMEYSRASISETVDELRDAVTQAVDWREHVKSHPGASLGIAAGAGVVLGRWIGGKITGGDGPPTAAAPYSAPPPSSAAQPGMLNGPASRAGARMESLVNLVIDEVADAVETAAIVPLFTRLRSFLRTTSEGEDAAARAGAAPTAAGPRSGPTSEPTWAGRSSGSRSEC